MIICSVFFSFRISDHFHVPAKQTNLQSQESHGSKKRYRRFKIDETRNICMSRNPTTTSKSSRHRCRSRSPFQITTRYRSFDLLLRAETRTSTTRLNSNRTKPYHLSVLFSSLLQHKAMILIGLL
jgi:hypothetical protein